MLHPDLEDVAQPVHQQEVPKLAVKQTASHREAAVVEQPADLLWVAAGGHQELLGQLEGQDVHGRGVVLAQGVVHVKPVAGNLPQPQCPEEGLELLCEISSYLLQWTRSEAELRGAGLEGVEGISSLDTQSNISVFL